MAEYCIHTEDTLRAYMQSLTNKASTRVRFTGARRGAAGSREPLGVSDPSQAPSSHFCGNFLAFLFSFPTRVLSATLKILHSFYSKNYNVCT